MVESVNYVCQEDVLSGDSEIRSYYDIVDSWHMEPSPAHPVAYSKCRSDSVKLVVLTGA